MGDLLRNIDSVRAVNQANNAFIATANVGGGPTGFWQLRQDKVSSMYPSGAFNASTTGGPTSLLQSGGPKQNRLEGKGTENLQRTQTQSVLRANLTRLVLPISMPEPFGQPGTRHIYRTFVSGDVMFSLRLTQQMVAHGEATPVTRHNHPQQVFTMNLQTVNYLLLNLQECLLHDAANGNNQRAEESSKQRWHNYLYQIMHEDFAAKQLLDEFNNLNQHLTGEDKYQRYTTLKRYLWHFLKRYVRVTGVYIGSEQQGGQHQGAANPCSHNPTDYVGTVQTMGKYEKTRNLWTTSKRGVGNGDLLGFTLRYIKPIDARNQRILLSGNPSTPQQANMVSTDETFGRFVLVPAVYEAMLQNRNEDLENVLDLYKQELQSDTLTKTHLYDIMHNASPGIAVSGGYFMQFGVVNEMSKGVTGSRDAVAYALDATACTMVMNCEVLLRFTVGEPPQKRQKSQIANANPYANSSAPALPSADPPVIVRQSNTAKQTRARAPIIPSGGSGGFGGGGGGSGADGSGPTKSYEV